MGGSVGVYFKLQLQPHRTNAMHVILDTVKRQICTALNYFEYDFQSSSTF